jgi:hypothetical protein
MHGARPELKHAFILLQFHAAMRLRARRKSQSGEQPKPRGHEAAPEETPHTRLLIKT